MREGLIAAENAAGKDSAFDYQVPSVVYTSPEWAGVGLTEEEAKRAGYKVKVGKFPLAASGRALTLGGAEGMVKVVGDEETDLLLGVFIVGPQAGSSSPRPPWPWRWGPRSPTSPSPSTPTPPSRKASWRRRRPSTSRPSTS